MNPIEIKISTDYSVTPGPRYMKEGDNSGEKFRKNIFLPALKKAINEKIKLIINLDGTAGYATSFLEETFGGLIRVENMDYNQIIRTIEIVSEEEEFLKDDVLFYLKDANDSKNKKK